MDDAEYHAHVERLIKECAVGSGVLITKQLPGDELTKMLNTDGGRWQRQQVYGGKTGIFRVSARVEKP